MCICIVFAHNHTFNIERDVRLSNRCGYFIHHEAGKARAALYLPLIRLVVVVENQLLCIASYISEAPVKLVGYHCGYYVLYCA